MSPPTQTKFTGIRSVYEALKLAEYPCKLKPFNSKTPLQYVLMKPRSYLQELVENEERTYTMNIMFANDGLQAIDEPRRPYSDTLEFSIFLPFQLYQETMGESAFVIAAFNTLIPHGRFGVDNNYLPTFRYSLKTDQEFVSGFVVMEIVDSMFFFMDRLAAQLENVSSGEKSALEAIQAAELAIGTPPPISA